MLILKLTTFEAEMIVGAYSNEYLGESAKDRAEGDKELTDLWAKLDRKIFKLDKQSTKSARREREEELQRARS